jgi:hypothetical protein
MYFVNTKFMWKIAIIGFVLMLVGLCPILTGCGAPPSAENASKDNTWMSHGNCTSTKVVEIEGHKYIIMTGFKCGGIIHAESCTCKKQ